MTFENRPRRLSERDAHVLDQLAESGFDPSLLESLDGEDRERGEVLCDLFEKLDDYPVENASDDLVAATLSRVRRAEDERANRMQIGAAETAGAGQLSGRRWRFPDLFATAAMLLLAVGVIWPIANAARGHRMVALDSSNLSENGSAMSSYANANNGKTPMEAVASIMPDPFEWLNSSHSGRHNAAIQKACASYANEDDFYRPEADPKAHAYSFQLWHPGCGDLMSEGRPIAANTNPLPGLGGETLSVEQADRATTSHGGKGQNILFGDGSVEMTKDSTIDGDRIWAPGTDSTGLIIRIIRGGDPGEDAVFLIH